MAVPAEIVEAARTGRAVRLHTRAGEVVVARVLHYDDAEVVYAVIHSSRPERYGVCDSTGFTLPTEAIERAQLLGREPVRRRAVIE